MVSDRVTIHIGVDTTEVNTSIDETKAKADAVVQKWRLDRTIIIQQVRETITLLSQTMSVYRQFMTIIGAQVDTFFSALIGMSLSTISMMLSISASLAATGVGAGAALVIGGIAVTLQGYMLGKLIGDKLQTIGFFDLVLGSLSNTDGFRRGFTIG